MDAGGRPPAFIQTRVAVQPPLGAALLAPVVDGGAQSFGPASALNFPTAQAGDDRQPHLATDGDTWMAVWQSDHPLGDTIGADRDILLARSTDAGTNWSAAAPLHGNAGSDSGHDERPRVATDGGGTWIAVWDSTDSLGGTIGGDPDVLFARSTDGRLGWSPPAAIHDNAASDFWPDLATDGAGTWLAVWESDDPTGGIGSDFDVFVARSTDGGATWGAAAIVNANAAVDTGDDRRARVATDDSGAWVVVWESNDSLGGTIGTDYDILMARSTDGGQSWSAPVALNSNAASPVLRDDRSPVILADGTGTWLTVWHSDDPFGGFGFDWDIRVSRSTDAGQTWSAAAAVNTDAATDSASDQRPQLTADGAGSWFVAWTSAFGTTGSDFDVLGAGSANGGVSWSAPVVVNSDAPFDNPTAADIDPAIATDGAGTWFTAWQGTTGTEADIRSSRSSDGGATWSPFRTLNSNAP